MISMGAIFTFQGGIIKTIYGPVVLLALMLGVGGTAGLLMAGLRRTYNHNKYKRLATRLIKCGFAGLALVILLVVLAYLLEATEPYSGGIKKSYPYVQYTILVLLFAWPVSAGVVALKELRNKNVSS